MFIRAVFALALLWFTVPGFCGYSTVLETIFATPYIVSNIQFNTTQRPDKSWNDTITFEVTSNHTQSSTFCWVSFSNIAPPPTTFFPCDHSPTNDTSFRVKFNTSFADWNANPSVIHPFTLGISNAWESVYQSVIVGGPVHGGFLVTALASISFSPSDFNGTNGTSPTDVNYVTPNRMTSIDTINATGYDFGASSSTQKF